MVVDALLEADQTLHLADKIHSPEDFVHLNDSILDTVGAVCVRCCQYDWKQSG